MNRQKKSLLNHTYRQFLQMGFGLEDSKKLKTIVDDQLMGFGTTYDEKIMNFAELKKLLKQQKRQSKGLNLSWKIKPLTHYTSADENTAIYADEVTLKVNTEGETVKMPIRFSIILVFTNNYWKVIHWHASKPENVQSEVDTFGIETWKQKTEVLEKIVKERTRDLVEKNKELAIEAALEKVRAVALSLTKSDEMLNVAKVLYEQLLQLGFTEIRNALIDIHDDKTETFMDYDYSKLMSGSVTRMSYYDDSFIVEQVRKIESSNDAFFELVLKGKRLQALIDLRIKNGEKPDPRLLKIDQLTYNLYSFGNGAIGISNFGVLNEKQKKILERFRNVFTFAYKRYSDLAQAEAQTRKAQIELALERVRARTMAMLKPEEFVEVIQVIGEQFIQLGFDVEWVNFGATPLDIAAGIDTWNFTVNPEADPLASRLFIPRFNHPLFQEAAAYLEDYLKTGNDFFVLSFKKKEKDKWLHHLFSKTSLKDLPDEYKTVQYAKPGYTTSNLILKDTFLSIGKFDTYPFTDEQNAILKKFGNAFGQAFTRFNDLQKSEAQIRESQIELALERVRASTMAMQKSDELKEVIQVVYEQLVQLNILVEHAGFIMDYKDKTDMHIWLADANNIPSQVTIPYFDSPHWNSFTEAKQTGKNFFDNQLSFKEKNKFYKTLFKLISVPEEAREFYLKSPGLAISTVLLTNVGLYMENFTGNPYSNEENAVLMRFGKVFQQTYTRFLDLQKAEAQARESQIEAGMERVRSRTMAMHSSEDVGAATATMFTELEKLGIKNLRGGIAIISPDKTQEIWSVNNLFDGTGLRAIGNFDMRLHPFWQQIFKAYQKKKEFDYYWLSGKDKEDYIRIINAAPGYLPRPIKEFPDVHIQSYFFSDGGIWTNSLLAHTEEQKEVMKKFASVFSLTFRRYQDLQKAEAQIREAQIEAALEKVRSRSLAMHKSEEIKDVVKTVVEKITELNIEKNSGIALTTFIPKSKDSLHWLWIPGKTKEVLKAYLPYFNHTLQKEGNKAREQGDALLAKVYSGKEKQSYFRQLFNKTDFSAWPEDVKVFVLQQPYFGFSFAIQKHSGIFLNDYSGKYFSKQTNDILIRFSKVFEQSYVRFLDLQNAEAQAREAQIETALEKVRSRSLAMHKSNELEEVIMVVSEQLQQLQFRFHNVGFVRYNKDKGMYFWLASPGRDQPFLIEVPYLDNPIFNRPLDAIKNGNDFMADLLTPKENHQWLNHMINHSLLKNFSEEDKRNLLNTRSYTRSVVLMKQINLVIGNYAAIPYSEEQNLILKRFAKVFDQAYTRFLDLQKAEANAREATIEASLERVRAKAMAMHSSKDLAETIGLFYQEIKLLNNTPRRCGVCLMFKDTPTADITTMSTTEQGNSLEASGKLKLTGHPVLEKVYDNWILQKEYHPVLHGKDIQQFYKIINTQMHYPDYPNDVVQYGYFFYFPEGSTYVWTIIELTEDVLQIYRRFTSVLSLTYKRFKDFQAAEVNAREGVKQAALDRIRADIASMRTAHDLERITPLIWKELTILGIPFIRCGVFIMDESQQLIHTFLSTPDGKAIAAFHIPFDSQGKISKVLNHWYLKKKYCDYWSDDEFIKLADLLVQQKVLDFPEQYLGTLPPGGFCLNFLPFQQGMLYVGNTTQLNEEELKSIQAVASAFSTAYARYEDFNKLEAAKKQVDSTLAELQATQKQLIQSEKMASLGELTAGIAHEIQNPLNFVNNFSEVSKELLDEMRAAIENGHADEAKTIMKDVILNLEKINHHGKRAGDIVKGMLQHSRKSTGVKELTNINALCDEYLRLAYHGLRAKDKTFNSGMKTDFDNTIGEINIIPQDIGRVVLNLITNAFYAANAKAKQNISGYEPLVEVSTKKASDKILISVKDNGNGIPQNIVDKIFQPFFTTKPTGQGTGLGLSLSYDIIKAIGGEIKVESKESDGSEFTIILPIIIS